MRFLMIIRWGRHRDGNRSSIHSRHGLSLNSRDSLIMSGLSLSSLNSLSMERLLVSGLSLSSLSLNSLFMHRLSMSCLIMNSLNGLSMNLLIMKSLSMSLLIMSGLMSLSLKSVIVKSLSMNLLIMKGLSMNLLIMKSLIMNCLNSRNILNLLGLRSLQCWKSMRRNVCWILFDRHGSNCRYFVVISCTIRSHVTCGPNTTWLRCTLVHLLHPAKRHLECLAPLKLLHFLGTPVWFLDIACFFTFMWFVPIAPKENTDQSHSQKNRAEHTEVYEQVLGPGAQVATRVP